MKYSKEIKEKCLLEILKGLKWKSLHIVVGIGADKDVNSILEKLSTLPQSKLYLTETTLKPLKIENYPEEWKMKVISSSAQVKTILDALSTEAQEEDLVLVTGSLYLIGKVLELLEHENHF